MDARVVLERDAAAALVALEEFTQRGDQRRAVRVIGCRRVGRGQQPRAQRLEIEGLDVVESRTARRGRREEPVDIRWRSLMRLPCRVGRTARHQHRLVSQRERTVKAAHVPDQCCARTGLQDAARLGSRKWQVEPVEGLRCGQELDAAIREAAGFGRAVDADEVRLPGKGALCRGAHRCVRLDAVNLETGSEQFAGEQASAGTDIRDGVARLDRCFAQQPRRQRRRITRTRALVVGDAVAEAFGGAVAVGVVHGLRRTA